MNSTRFAALAAFLGGLAVMLGAIGAHMIRDIVSPAELDIWKTGAQYHLVHSVALLALALHDKEGKYRVICWLWVAGISIFGGTLYLLALTHVKILGAITPIGGVCLIVGWLMLGVKLLKTETIA